MPPPSDVVVQARQLRKEFGGFTAVKGIDFTIRRGEFFGFLGPNGAGKTSTMRMIACMSPRTSGELVVRGLDPEHHGPQIRAGIGLVPQEDALDIELTVLDNLLLYGRYFGIPRKEVRSRALQLLEFAQLEERAKAKVDALSGGMRRRLVIARALISRPDLVILDEPTTGLDPQARHLVWERLYQLKQQGVTLVLTTHYMDEAEQLCDRLVVMDRGEIAAEGAPRALISEYSSREVLELRLDDDDRPLAKAVLAEHADRVEELTDRLCCYAQDGEALLETVQHAGVRPRAALVRRGSLEDVFLRLTGRSLVD